MLRAIGDKSKQHAGPNFDMVKLAIDILENNFCLSGPKPGRTQLHQGIYQAWVEEARYPDKYVPEWLLHGTPQGVEQSPQDAGIFPKVDQRVAAEDRRPLVLDHERLVNYVSIEESDFGFEVLDELVDNYFVDRYRTLAEAKAAFGGREPVLAKLALITTC